MKRITVHDNISVTSDESDICLSAGNGRMILEINYGTRRMPMKTYRRAMTYRSFLTLVDMPVYVYVNNKKLLRVKGKHFWVYRPVDMLGWMIRNFIAT